jgi:hypothetical protein
MLQKKNEFVHDSFSITSDSDTDESISHDISVLDIFNEEH